MEKISGNKFHFLGFSCLTNEAIVSESMAALLSIKFPAAIDSYRKLLNDNRKRVHLTAMSCLVQLGIDLDINVRNDIESLLTNENESIRKKAKQILWLYDELLKEKNGSK